MGEFFLVGGREMSKFFTSGGGTTHPPCRENPVNSGWFLFYWWLMLLWVMGVGFENTCTVSRN